MRTTGTTLRATLSAAFSLLLLHLLVLGILLRSENLLQFSLHSLLLLLHLGTTSLTLKQSFGASPGYTAETSTLMLIQAFLYAISALVIGAFFTVVTIQRKHEIAVLRAMGASSRYLLRDSLAQSAILLLLATSVGVGVGLLLGAWLSSTPMPFALDLGAIGLASGLTIVLGMLGAAVAVLRITRVDPLTALGGNR